MGDRATEPLPLSPELPTTSARNDLTVAGLEALHAGAGFVAGTLDSVGHLQDIDQGYSHSIAVVIPPRPAWPLRGYELALLIALEANSTGASP